MAPCPWSHNQAAVSLHANEIDIRSAEWARVAQKRTLLFFVGFENYRHEFITFCVDVIIVVAP